MNVYFDIYIYKHKAIQILQEELLFEELFINCFSNWQLSNKNVLKYE